MNFKQHFLFPFIALLLLTSGCKSQSNALSYLALGDSYTIGESVSETERWPVQLVDTLQRAGIKIDKPKIIAKTGWTTVELRTAIADAELNAPYDLVSLLIGVNDQYDGLNFDDYPDRFEYLLEKAITLAGNRPGHVFVVSIPDYSVTPFGQSKNPAKISREIAKYNTTNQSIADRLGVHYINITPGSTLAANDTSLVAGDGLHPSGNMYRQWVEKIMPVMLPEIKTWKSPTE